MVSRKILIGVVFLAGITFLLDEVRNIVEGCCPASAARRRQQQEEGPQDDGAEARQDKEKKKEEKKESSSEKKETPSDKAQEKKESDGSGSGGGTGGGLGDTSGGGSPAPGSSSRPPLKPGIQPLIQSLRTSGISLLGVVDPWEVWWTRNRESYLNVHQPVEWIKVLSDAGGTASVKRYEECDKLINILDDVLYDKDQFVAFRAAIGLGRAKDDIAQTALKKAYETEKRFFVRNNIVFALGLSGQAATAQAVLSDDSDAVLSRCYAAAGLGFINDPAVNKLLQSVVSQKEDAELICCAALSLGNIGETASVQPLVNLLNPPKFQDTRKDARIRVHALLALSRIAKSNPTPETTKTVLSEITKSVTDKERDVRAAAAIALGMLNTQETKDALLTLLKDSSGLVRGLAAISLAQTGIKGTYDALTQIFRKSGEEDRGLIILALGFLKEDKAKVTLREILQGRKDRSGTKGAAAIASGLLKDKEAVPILLDIISKSDDPVLTPYALLALGMIGDDKAVEPLNKRWTAFDKTKSQPLGYTNLAIALTLLGKRDELVIPELLKHCAQDQPEALRACAFHTLGILGSRENAAVFIDAYTNEHLSAELRKAVVNGIGFLLDKNTVPLMNKFTADNFFDISLIIMDHLLPIPVW